MTSCSRYARGRSSSAAISARLAGPCPKCRPSWTISRTPYSPFVENETAPLPWNMGLPEGLDAWVSGGSSIPSDFVGIECRAKPEIGSTRVLPRESRGRRNALTVGRQNGSARLGPVFWRLWTSTASSNLGDGIGKTGFPLLAVLLTRDPIQVSLLTAAFFLPWLVFALPSGAIIDRVDRSRAMTLANAGPPGRLATVVYGTIPLGSVVGGVVAATFGLTAPLVVLGAVQGLLLVFGWRLMGRAAS